MFVSSLWFPCYETDTKRQMLADTTLILARLQSHRIMRYYEEIWLTIKRDGYVRLAVPKALHRRVIKATLKEKYQDFGFKLEMMQQHTAVSLHIKRQDGMITITLVKRLRLYQSIRLEEL